MKPGAFCCHAIVTVVCIELKKIYIFKHMHLSYSFLCAFICQSQIFSTRNSSSNFSVIHLLDENLEKL